MICPTPKLHTDLRLCVLPTILRTTLASGYLPTIRSRVELLIWCVGVCWTLSQRTCETSAVLLPWMFEVVEPSTQGRLKIVVGPNHSRIRISHMSVITAFLCNF